MNGGNMDWNKAPRWAKWYAEDKNGKKYWYEKKPWINERWKCWNTEENNAYVKIFGKTEPNENWKDSLIKRPKKLDINLLAKKINKLRTKLEKAEKRLVHLKENEE
jgi:hypothetical protein